jgi:hypothetical protein
VERSEVVIVRVRHPSRKPITIEATVSKINESLVVLDVMNTPVFVCSIDKVCKTWVSAHEYARVEGEVGARDLVRAEEPGAKLLAMAPVNNLWLHRWSAPSDASQSRR